MVNAKGVNRFGERSAASLKPIAPADLHPAWDADVLAVAPERVVAEYVLSVDAVRLLLGAEGFAGMPAPASRQHVQYVCGRGQLDWITVGHAGRGVVRAFSRNGVEAYFRHFRKETAVPWHRLPVSLRRELNVDY